MLSTYNLFKTCVDITFMHTVNENKSTRQVMDTLLFRF